MILEIEYYKEDTQLIGRPREYSELKKQLDEAEKLYDRKNDNFVDLLCRMFDWDKIETFVRPDYVYDRDLSKLLRAKS